jgi:hypothetical protein
MPLGDLNFIQDFGQEVGELVITSLHKGKRDREKPGGVSYVHADGGLPLRSF